MGGLKQASFYLTVNDKIQCSLCAHQCIILKEKKGICGVRKNIDNKLFTLVYENPIAIHVDPIEKKPLYHFLPGSFALSIGTIGCNFKCNFCQNHDISQTTHVQGDHIPIKEIINYALNHKCEVIAYTYTEPTIFIEFALDTAKQARKKGIKNIFVTNGYMTKNAMNKIAKYIDAMNIDLKSFSDEFYKKYCKARLQPVLDSIKLAHDKGIWIEITTLLLENINDSEAELKNIAEFIASIDKEIPWHVSKAYPMYKMKDLTPTTKDNLQKAKKVGEKAGLKHVYLGNITNNTNTYCPSCNKLLIKRDYGLISSINNCSCGYKIKGVFNGS